MWSFCYVNGISHLQLKVVLLPNEFINTCCYIAYPTVTHIWQREERERAQNYYIAQFMQSLSEPTRHRHTDSEAI